MNKKKILITGFSLILIISILCTACAGSFAASTSSGNPKKQEDQFLKKMEKHGGEYFFGNSHGSKPLPGTPYSYEMWNDVAASSVNLENKVVWNTSSLGLDNKLIWYGPEYGGGGAFRAEWKNAKTFLGRVGLFWDKGQPYSYYNNTFCDFEFTRSENGTAGGTSYIGIYGWSKNPMIEWYIVEDWFGEGVIGPNRIGGNAEKAGEFTVDGEVYFIYKATRPAGSGNILGSLAPFPQYFSVRQTTRQSGTISISEHFKQWEKAGLKLGSNMYEAKFLIEAGSGTGWFDASHISFYQN